ERIDHIAQQDLRLRGHVDQMIKKFGGRGGGPRGGSSSSSSGTTTTAGAAEMKMKSDYVRLQEDRLWALLRQTRAHSKVERRAFSMRRGEETLDHIGEKEAQQTYQWNLTTADAIF
ncbi:unnamed protein product, partial [Amoebophrya sp. A25]